MPSVKKRFLQLRYVLYCTCLLLIQQSHALILYTGDNEANKTTPDTEREHLFDSVAWVKNIYGSSGSGSAVYLGGKYMLTAHHAGFLDWVTFDDITYWEIDKTFASVKVASKDMRVFKLKKTPTGITPVILNTSTSEVNKTGTMISWGRARNPSDNDGNDIWNWGNSGTEAKRWGTNKITQTATVGYGSYLNQEHIISRLDSNAGVNEAAFATIDSGSGLFMKIANKWVLAGLAVVATENAGASKSSFGGSTPDYNYFVRISSYASDIEAAIPDTETYGGWKIDHSLYGSEALDTADTDDDGIGQLLEFAFGGYPYINDSSILPSQTLTEDGGSTYLEISYTRPTFSNGLTYTVQTTTDLSSWPTDSNGVNAPVIVDNLDGTQTETYRRTLAVTSADEAFIRVDVVETP